MTEIYATFNYNGITDPESGSEYEHEIDGYVQWTRELHAAVTDWGDDLIAYKVLPRNREDRRVTVRFLVATARTVVEQADAIQDALFDQGGLSGSFEVGRERLYRVTYTATRDVYALSPEQAASRVPGAGYPCSVDLVDDVAGGVE